MKYVLKESQIENLSKEILKSANKIGYYETLIRYRLPFQAANIFLKPKNGEYFNAKELSNIFYYYIFYANQIPYKLNYKDFIIENSESESQGFYWDTDIIKNSGTRASKEACFGYAQPFWESDDINTYFGRKKTMALVCRFDFYNRGDWANPDDDYIEEDSFYKSYTFDMTGLKFKTLEETKNWYLTEYPKIVVEFAEDFFKSARLHNEKH